MPLTINESVMYFNRSATLTVTITLISHAEIDVMTRTLPIPNDTQPEPISVAINSGQTHTTIPLVNPRRSIMVSYQDIIAANPGFDLSDAFIHYEARLQMDRSQNEPLYPSDMVEMLRDSGVSEEEIQRLLANEEKLRNNQ